MSTDSQQMQILQMLDDAEISAAEALRRLDRLATPAAAAEHLPPDPGLERWRRWWLLPFWLGTAIALAGALLMFVALRAGGLGAWLLLAALPFALGVGVMALAAASNSARWLHIRVRHARGPRGRPLNIALSFPLPIRLAAWMLRRAGPRLPRWPAQGLDELILALAGSASNAAPLYVEVDQGDGGHVQVYVG